MPGQLGGNEKAKNYESLLGRVNSIVLRYGVIASCALIFIGILDVLLNAGKNLQITIPELIKSNFGRPSINPVAILTGITKLNGIYITEVGVLILLATPILRVGVTTIVFAVEKDRAYVAIGTLVLLVLLFSIFVVGPIEA
ncbi:MAG: DUF1634 domain-containing protein [Nitrososphaerota archaeon]|nr:DUF1634 domain-containing protein [Nitrososphaerota archaeon]